MSLPGDRREGPSPVPGGANDVATEDASRPATVAQVVAASQRLRLNPNKDHKPETYEDLQLDFSPSIFSSLEPYLPPIMLGVPRDDKVKFMREILHKYLPIGERNRVCFSEKFSFLFTDFIFLCSFFFLSLVFPQFWWSFWFLRTCGGKQRKVVCVEAFSDFHFAPLEDFPQPNGVYNLRAYCILAKSRVL
jgi:hypothetical protein